MISPPLAPDLKDMLAGAVAEIQRLADATREGDRDAAAELKALDQSVPGIENVVRGYANGMTYSETQAERLNWEMRREKIRERQKLMAQDYIDMETGCVKRNEKVVFTTLAIRIARRHHVSKRTAMKDIREGMRLIKE